MSNQTAAAIAAIAGAVNWERKGLDLQAIIEAGNKGELGAPLTDWLAGRMWANGQATQVAESKPALPSPLELLLLPLGTVLVSPTTSLFVAKDNFKLKVDGGICSYLGDNLKAWFLKGKGKIEPPFAGSTLQYAKLRKAATDMPQNPGKQAIIPELGGEAKAETTLSEMFSLMEKQKNGEDGVLLNNGYANIFYIRDGALVLRTVVVSWHGEGWSVCADSFEGAYGWGDGDQVFSRNSSVLESSVPSVPAQA
jgi:hypothetical protein